MTDKISSPCKPWQAGDPTLHPPTDRRLLETLLDAGFLTFTGPAGMCGAKADARAVVVLHRGRGRRWEIVFRENDADVVTTISTDLEGSTPRNAIVVAWRRPVSG